MAGDLDNLIEQVKAVSHPLRMRVLALLEPKELCVCQVAEVLGVPPSSVSEALKELRRAGFVQERKAGRRVYVSVVSRHKAPPLLKGILIEASLVAEIQRDRALALDTRPVPKPAACARAPKSAPSKASAHP
ncbi:MAG: winged helix-turn-helix transcriptional regulator [Acidobacteriota bacterium]|nr:winged helix-turn-helix transcriptional regulator [Acidobacteriota bacterium]